MRLCGLRCKGQISSENTAKVVFSSSLFQSISEAFNTPNIIHNVQKKTLTVRINGSQFSLSQSINSGYNAH